MGDVIALRPQLPKTLSRDEAAQLVRQVLEDSSNIRWTEHIFQRMEDRGFSDRQVLQVLKHGDVIRDPVFGGDRNWEITMEAVAAGDLVRVGVAIDVDKMGLFIIVITVIAP